MGLKPTTLYTLDRALYQLSYRGSSAGWAQVLHVQCHVHVYFNERWEGRKKEASKVKQTNKAKQHSTPKAVTFIYTCTCTCRTNEVYHWEETTTAILCIIREFTIQWLSYKPAVPGLCMLYCTITCSCKSCCVCVSSTVPEWACNTEYGHVHCMHVSTCILYIHVI